MVFGLRYVWMGYLLALSSEGTHTSEAKFEITEISTLWKRVKNLKENLILTHLIFSTFLILYDKLSLSFLKHDL